ncbi:MAG: hypothetical protein ACP5UM_12095, partial [Anaerolineae bacterium]
MSTLAGTRQATQRRNPRRVWKRRLSLALNLLVLVGLAFVVLVPILWMAQMSFRTAIAQFQMPPDWTQGWTLENYRDIIATRFQRNLLNSLIVSTATTLFSLGFGVPAAYALSRY